MEVLDHTVTLKLFERWPNCLTQLHHFTFPRQKYEDSHFFISSPALRFSFFLLKKYYSYSCEHLIVLFHEWYLIVLICIFPVSNDIEHPFMCLLAILYLFLEEWVSLLPILKLGCLSFQFWILYSGYYTLSRCTCCKYFPQFCYLLYVKLWIWTNSRACIYALLLVQIHIYLLYIYIYICLHIASSSFFIWQHSPLLSNLYVSS